MSQFKQYCHVENTAEECRWASFQDSDIAAGDWRWTVPRLLVGQCHSRSSDRPEEAILEAQPEVFSLDKGLFVQSLRSSRRGAAAGPSGMTADHLQPLLDTGRDTSLTEASEELWSETFSEGWSPGQWPNKWQRGWKPRQLHSSTPSPRRQVARVWPHLPEFDRSRAGNDRVNRRSGCIRLDIS